MAGHGPLWLYFGVLLTLTQGCAFGPGEGAVQVLDLEQAAHELRTSGDVRMEPGEHVAPAPLHGAVLRIEGRRDVVLDLREVVLRARRDGSTPDHARGTAIEIVGCERVVLRGGTLSGYRVGVLVRDSRDVTIEGLTVADGFAQRLESGVSMPDEDDRLELSPEDAEQWLERYGAAIAIVDSSEVRVKGASARRAQNGVVLASSFDCEVSDGDFSYLSGWGVALWRADGCVVSRNRLDVCVRGPLEGPRADGFGSSGLLVSGHSSRNLFAFNHAAGGGAGARVVAGPRGAGEGNRWYGNLFAPANGPGIAIEGGRALRLERNRITGPRGAGIELVDGADALLFENSIRGARGAAIVIRDGHACVIAGNVLEGSDRGLELLGAGGAPGADAVVIENRFQGNVLDLVLEEVGAVQVSENSVVDSTDGLDLSGLGAATGPDQTARERWALFSGPGQPLASGRARGASLVPAGISARTILRGLRFEAPPAAAGSASVVHGDSPAGFAMPRLGSFGPWDPTGESPFEPPSAPGGLLAGRGFEASWFTFDSTSDPRGDLDAWRARRFDAAARGSIDAWRDPWGSAARRAQIGTHSFGLVATGTIELEQAGSYRLDATFDDGLRVLIDDVAVIEDWAWHPARSERVTIELEAGAHAVRVEYFQLDGAAELALSLDPVEPELARVDP